MTALVVPYRAGEPHRDRNWQWIRNRYRNLHGWTPITADSPGDWSKGEAVNTAVAACTDDVLVIADADSYTDPDTLNEAVHLCDTGAPWVVPHGMVYRWSEWATQLVLNGQEPNERRLDRQPYEGPPGGGIVVVRREAFDTVGGMDPFFVGWGGEDHALAYALSTLVGPHVRVGGDLFHLWHPHPSPSLAKPEPSERRLEAYRRAQFVPRLMRNVRWDRNDPPPPPLAEPRVFRAARADHVVHVAGGFAQFSDHLFQTTDPELADAMRWFANVEEVTPSTSHAS